MLQRYGQIFHYKVPFRLPQKAQSTWCASAAHLSSFSPARYSLKLSGMNKRSATFALSFVHDASAALYALNDEAHSFSQLVLTRHEHNGGDAVIEALINTRNLSPNWPLYQGYLWRSIVKKRTTCSSLAYAPRGQPSALLDLWPMRTNFC